MEISRDFVHLLYTNAADAVSGDESRAEEAYVRMPESAVIGGADVSGWIFRPVDVVEAVWKGPEFRRILVQDPVELSGRGPDPMRITVRAQSLKEAFTAAYCRSVLDWDLYPDPTHPRVEQGRKAPGIPLGAPASEQARKGIE